MVVSAIYRARRVDRRGEKEEVQNKKHLGHCVAENVSLHTDTY